MVFEKKYVEIGIKTKTHKKTYLKDDLYFQIGNLKFKKDFLSVRDKKKINQENIKFQKEIERRNEEIQEYIIEKKLNAENNNEKYAYLKQKDLTGYDIKFQKIVSDLYNFLINQNEFAYYFNPKILIELKLYLKDLEKLFYISYSKKSNLLLIQINNLQDIQNLL